MWQAYKVYTSVFTFEYDKKNSLFKIRVEWHDPVIAAKWANQIAMRVNRHFKDQRLAYAEKSIAFLKNQLEQANLVEMREVLFNLIENQTRTVMLAHASDESVLNIIDAAVVPEEKIRPNNSAIFLMSLFLGVSLGLLIIIIMYYRHIIIRNSTG